MASVIGMATLGPVSWLLFHGVRSRDLGPMPPVVAAMQGVEGGMRLLLIAVAASLALLLVATAHRKPLARLLADGCAGLSAAMGVFFVSGLLLQGLDQQVGEWIALPVMLITVAFLGVWLYTTAKFFLAFPKQITVVPCNEPPSTPRGRYERRWFPSPQSLALAVGIALILLVDRQADRLFSDTVQDVVTYFICWLPFAVLATKQRHLDDAGRRAIRWILFGQALWLLLFIAGTLGLLAIRSAGILPLQNWNQEELFTGAFLAFFFDGFLIALIASLAFSIFYDGSLDPDLMIGRAWMLGAFGLASGALFVVAERLFAGILGGWLDLSAGNAMTLIAALTACVLYPLRSWLEGAARRAIDRWQSFDALANGARREAVIVFADLSGYTALTERDERQALIMAGIFHRDAEAAARAGAGRLIKTIGDAAMLRFSDTEKAYDALRELKRAFHSHVSAIRFDPLPIHAAIHRGEVVEGRNGDVFGATVNLAARLLGAAGPDEIVASGTSLANTSLGQRARSLGERRFKNVTLPVECFELARS